MGPWGPFCAVRICGEPSKHDTNKAAPTACLQRPHPCAILPCCPSPLPTTAAGARDPGQVLARQPGSRLWSLTGPHGEAPPGSPCSPSHGISWPQARAPQWRGLCAVPTHWAQCPRPPRCWPAAPGLLPRGPPAPGPAGLRVSGTSSSKGGRVETLPGLPPPCPLGNLFTFSKAGRIRLSPCGCPLAHLPTDRGLCICPDATCCGCSVRIHQTIGLAVGI